MASRFCRRGSGRDAPQGIATKAAPARASVLRRMAAGLCVSALLAACSSVPVLRAPASTTQALATQFSLSGRFSAKTASEQVSGQFRYTQNGADRTLNLFSPLGTPLADIIATRDSATLTQANGGTQTAASLAELLRTVIDLPVTDAMMSAWLQGLPSTLDATAVKGEARDATGLLTRFTESGWSIEISVRMEAGQGTQTATNAPRRMRWSVAGLPDTEVRWAIDAWTTP